MQAAWPGVSGTFERWFLTARESVVVLKGSKTKLVATITVSMMNLNEENT